MRVILRTLSILSLIVFGYGLFNSVYAASTSSCPVWDLFNVFIIIIGGYGLLPAVIGSAVAAGFAAVRRQWGWLAVLLVAAGADLAFLYSVTLDPPPSVLAPIATLVGRALSVAGCKSHNFQAIAIILVLLPTPLVLLGYTFPATWPNRDRWSRKVLDTGRVS
jgi:hypothetical protein